MVVLIVILNGQRCVAVKKSAVFEIDLLVVVVYISPFVILCEAGYVKKNPLGFLNDKR